MCFDGQWGTMCGYESITTYSNVICRQLGYSPNGANVYNNSYFGQGNGGILLYTPSLLCMGNERTLLDCAHAPVGYHLCNDHSNDVGVSCQGKFSSLFYTTIDILFFLVVGVAILVSFPATFNNMSECRSGSIRLVGGNYANQGTVEFCIGGTWNTICGYPWDWNENNTIVLCRQLGLKSSSRWICLSVLLLFKAFSFSEPTTYFNSNFGQGRGFSLQLQAACTGNENSVFLCPTQTTSTYYYQQYTYSCNNHIYDIGIQCYNNGMIQQLEIKSIYKNGIIMVYTVIPQLCVHCLIVFCKL